VFTGATLGSPEKQAVLFVALFVPPDPQLPRPSRDAGSGLGDAACVAPGEVPGCLAQYVRNWLRGGWILELEH